MRLFVLILSVLMVCLSSCGKKRSIHILAKNAATGEVYSSLEYIILSSRTTANGEKFRTEASGLLSATGEAIEEVKVRGNRTYKVRVTAPANNCFNKEVEQYFESKYDANGKFTFEFAPCAYLKFRYQNVNCFDEQDRIEVTRYTSINDYVGFTNPAVYDGCTDYTMSNFASIPMGNWYFEWKVIKNGVTNTFADTIFLSPDEYKYYEFNY